MDVFYYWKDFAADMKTGRVGRFRSAKERLDELHEGCPSYIWAFRTPAGRKGELQLLARLAWSDKSLVKFAPAAGESHIFYDPDHPHSVWFEGTGSDQVLGDSTKWVRNHLPAAQTSNFQGMNGQHAMRGLVLSSLVAVSRPLGTRPFRSGPSAALDRDAAV